MIRIEWVPQEYIDENGHHWIEIKAGSWELLFQHLEMKEKYGPLNEKEKQQLHKFRHDSPKI